MYRVLVFPSCNEPGLEVVHALAKSNKITVIGASSLPTSQDPSCEILHHHVCLPWHGTPEFTSEVFGLLERWEIDLVFPTVDTLVAEFSTWRHPRTRFVTPPRETAFVLLSKKETYQRLAPDIPTPEIYTQWPAPLPAYGKPDRGSGARGNVLIQTKADYERAAAAGLLVMEYLPGEEFTVDCVSDLEGRLLFANPRRREKVDRSISIATWPVEDDRLLRYAAMISEKLRMRGPWFAQFKMDKEGTPRLMEVNGRAAGSMTLTRLQGVNIPLITVFLYMGYEVQIPRKLPGIGLKRILKNIVPLLPFRWVVWDLDDTLIRKDGKPDPDCAAAVVDLRNRGVRQIVFTKNRDVQRLLDQTGLAGLLPEVVVTEDKVQQLPALFAQYGIDPVDCILVNDSYTEKLALQARFPSLRIVTPDAIEVLGRERI